jgi:molybdopterin/thiamine biosynthesis adenylyltransferase
MERHNRTAALLEALGRMSRTEGEAFLESLVFGLRVTREVADTPSAQVATLTAANLLSRLGGSVAIEVASTPLKLRGLPWKDESLDLIASSIVDWSGGRVEQNRSPDAWIVVGGASTDDAVAASGTNWTANVDAANYFAGSHPLGAAAASCLAAGRAFHLALARRLGTPGPSREPVSFSLLTSERADEYLPSADDSVGAGPTPEALLVGAGAVANGFAWAASTCSLPIGRLTVIDPQVLDESNLNRHIAAGARDLGRPKAAILSEFLSPVTADLETVVGMFSRITQDRTKVPIVLSTVDNDDARYQIQGCFPRLVIHGATSQEHLAVAVLDASDGACLGCLFPRPQRSPVEVIAEETGVPSQLIAAALEPGGVFITEMVVPMAKRFKVDPSELKRFVGHDFRHVYAIEICGRLGSQHPASVGAPTVAYVSALTGILVAAELTKLSSTATSRHVLHNYLQMTPLVPSAAWVAFRGKDPNCPLMCGSEALQSFLANRK